MKATLLLVAIFVVISVAIFPPDLPDAFQAKVTLTVPFFGKLPGTLYFDYVQLSYRIDTAIFGSKVVDIYRYDIDPPTHFQISDGQPCTEEPINGELFPMSIPPIATYQGQVTIDGQDTEFWDFNFFGFGDMKYYVGNHTNPDGKVESYMVRFVYSQPNIGLDLEWDFQNVVAGPQNPNLFEVVSKGCQKPTPPPTFNIQGYVKSAVDNSIISGATVKLGSSQTTSNANGIFSFQNVQGGNISITASKSGFFSATNDLQLSQDIGAGTIADFSLSPVLNPGQLRAVLRWGAVPRDLDSHTITPSKCEVYFRNKQCSSGGSTVTLDVDATQGYGPETTTFSSLTAGTYTFYVYIYSTDGGYVNSGGRVQVFGGSGLVADVLVPQTGFQPSARYWKVFTVDGTSGKVTIVNQVTNSL